MALADSIQSTLSLPVVVSPMFLVSSPKMVVASCRNGLMGSFPALNARTSEGYEDWLKSISGELSAEGITTPYAVNLIVHGSNSRLKEDLALTVKYKVPVVITSLGAAKEVIDAVHSYGGLVFHDVTTLRFAEKAIEAGADGLIAVASGAGGHAGTYNIFAFIRELRRLTDKTILAAGGINCGESILAAQAAGADLAYMGTHFIACEESSASDEYKAMLADANAKDIIYTPKVSGIPANFMRQSLEKNGIDVKTSVTPDMDIESEAKAWSQVWSAGQGVGAIDKVKPLDEICAQLKQEYQNSAKRLAEAQSRFIS